MTAQKLPSGSWRVQFTVDGKRYSVVKPTKARCEAEASRIRADAMEGKSAYQEGRATVAEVMDRYIRELPPTTSPSTLRGYKTIRNNRFRDILNKPASSINWQRVIDADAAQYSPKTIRNEWGFMKSCLTSAGLTVPKIRLPQAQRHSIGYLPSECIKSVLEEIKGDKHEIAILLALHSLRRSEIMALEWSDIDLKKGTIHVHGATVPDENCKFVKKSQTKTAASTRYIPIMIPRLRELVEEGGDGPVWTGGPEAVNRTMAKVCAKLGIEPVTTHGLRHSFASLAYHLGMSEMETMQIGGWSDYQTMRKIYTHISEDDKKKAANSMAAFYGNL